MAHLITGYAGYAHIKSSDEGAFNASFFGGGQYVMDFGNCFEGSILDNNTVRILDGDGLMYGRHFRIEPNTYEDMTIETGTAGMNRIDLICMTYKKDPNDETETAYLEVIKGTETAGTAVVPEYTDGNILEGASLNQMPLYKVTLEGVVLKKIDKMFETIPSYEGLARMYAERFEAACEELRESFTLENILKKADVVDNLISDATDLPVSAKQAKNLKGRIDAVEDSITFAESKALVSDASGKISASNTTSTEIERLSGLKSNAQSQLNTKIEYTTGQYASLKDFVESIESHGSPGLIMGGRWKDTNGSWTPNGTASWYRGFACLQNSPSSGSDVGGFVVCQRASNFSTYVGYISGTKTSGYKIAWSRVATLLYNSQFVNEVNQQLYIAASSETDYRAFLGVKGSSWMFCPETSMNLMLGGPNNLWGDIYSANAVIQTSDRNVKKDVRELTEQHLKFFRMLQPVSFAFINGTSGRTHVGFISQDVEEAMTACGLSDLDFAGFCKDQKTIPVEKIVDGETIVEDIPVEGEFVYSLRYEEFIGLVTQATQEALNRIDAIEKKLNALESKQ